MPPPPEIVEGPRLKRGLEVLDQVIAQNARRAQGNVAAIGKVHVQLHGKQHRGGHEVRAAHAADIAVDQRDIVAQVVGNDHLFGVAPQHAERTACAAGVAEPAGFVDLWPKMGVPLNGAGGHGGKKADEQRIMQRVQLNLAAALVYINGVAERSKGKVAQAQRGNHIRAGLQYRAAQDIRGEQVPVFVIEQKPHTGEHRQKQENHPHGTYPAFADHQPAAPCDQCCRNQNRYQQAVVGPQQ